MRPRELRLLIQDVQGCILQIESFTAGLDFADFQRSALVQRGVERDCEIIGEAITRMRRVSNEVSQRVDEAIRISGFRNLLAHEYEVVDEKKVWKIAQDSLPKLKQQIDTWAAELGMEAPPQAGT